MNVFHLNRPINDCREFLRGSRVRVNVIKKSPIYKGTD